jgi:hypothetical protein
MGGGKRAVCFRAVGERSGRSAYGVDRPEAACLLSGEEPLESGRRCRSRRRRRGRPRSHRPGGRWSCTVSPSEPGSAE